MTQTSCPKAGTFPQSLIDREFFYPASPSVTVVLAMSSILLAGLCLSVREDQGYRRDHPKRIGPLCDVRDLREIPCQLCNATPFSPQGKLGVPGLPGYPGRQGPKVTYDRAHTRPPPRPVRCHPFAISQVAPVTKQCLIPNISQCCLCVAPAFTWQDRKEVTDN